jgi:hypothetical protein
MQQLSFFEEEAIGKELVFGDLGSVVRGKDADAVLEAISSRSAPMGSPSSRESGAPTATTERRSSRSPSEA